MYALAIHIHNSPGEAPNWNHTPDVRGATLEEAHIVRKGTVQGRCTVDLVLVDREGQRFVAMVTGAIAEALAAAVRGAEMRGS